VWANRQPARAPQAQTADPPPRKAGKRQHGNQIHHDRRHRRVPQFLAQKCFRRLMGALQDAP
jgi:hypothetical protein